MNCKTFQNQIDELTDQAFAPDEVVQHLNVCSTCQDFKAERARLSEMLRQLETIDAPADFNFHLKARLRKQKGVQTNFGWRKKLAWTVPATLAATVALGFVITKNTFVESPAVAVNSNPPQFAPEMAQVQPTPPMVDDIAPQIKSEQISKSVREEEEVASFNKVAEQRAARREPKRATIASSKPKPQSEKEIVRSRDVTVVGSETIGAPKGIPDQLKSSNKLHAKQLLLTLGIETKEDVGGLRVVSISEQAARSNLQPDDLIQKVNNENPAVVSGNEFKELNLTVRRKEQTQEILVPVKP